MTWLTYLIKKFIFIPKKHLDVFKSNYIFWFFDSYFSKSDLFNFCNDEDKDEFLQFLDKYFKNSILTLYNFNNLLKNSYFCPLNTLNYLNN
nr:hypothetical protein [Mycoplasmopsis bovis]